MTNQFRAGWQGLVLFKPNFVFHKVDGESVVFERSPADQGFCRGRGGIKLEWADLQVANSGFSEDADILDFNPPDTHGFSLLDVFIADVVFWDRVEGRLGDAQGGAAARVKEGLDLHGPYP